MSEWEMVLACKDYFEDQVKYQKVVCEIPFLSRCIDMVLLDKEDDVITIEFKLTKWREAILQAYDHKRGADYSYVCMPKRKPSDKFIMELKERGIGLLLYDDNSERDLIQVYLEAPKSNRKVQLFSNELKNMVEFCEQRSC